MVRVRSGVVSITGDFRENNEDNALADSDARFFLVADGMGGQAAGEIASQLAVQIIPDKLPPIGSDTDRETTKKYFMDAFVAANE